MTLIEESRFKDYLNLAYRRDLGILLLRWIKKTKPEELRFGYNRSLEAARQHNTNYWFFDLRRRGSASSSDEGWIMNEFFLKVLEEAPGPHYFAYLVSPSHLQKLDQTIGLKNLETLHPGIKIRVFNSEDDAINWLLMCQKAGVVLEPSR